MPLWWAGIFSKSFVQIWNVYHPAQYKIRNQGLNIYIIYSRTITCRCFQYFHLVNGMEDELVIGAPWTSFCWISSPRLPIFGSMIMFLEMTQPVPQRLVPGSRRLLRQVATDTYSLSTSLALTTSRQTKEVYKWVQSTEMGHIGTQSPFRHKDFDSLANEPASAWTKWRCTEFVPSLPSISSLVHTG